MNCWAIGENGLTAWNIAAENGKKEILEKLWSWGREEQINLKDELLGHRRKWTNCLFQTSGDRQKGNSIRIVLKYRSESKPQK
jgi:hypothetical protein